MKAVSQSQYLRLVPVLCLGLLLFFTFRLFTFSYFWVDDFNNLHWIQQWSVLEGIQHVVSPSAEHFRPVGMLVYQIAFKLFALDAWLYHVLMWALHSINVALVYVVLKRLTASSPGAAVGAMLFASSPLFHDIFWSFGMIFELMGMLLFLVGILLWQLERRSLGVVLGASAVFILAIKTKEMAITLPAVWLMQDLLLRRPLKWKDVAWIAIPGLVGIWYGLQKVLEMRGSNPNDPYYMDMRGIVLGRAYGFYFNTLFETNLRWQVWAISFVVVLLILLGLRWRRAAFFQIYAFVTFLPLIFLVNHRFSFYWYFPLLGVCGIAALLVQSAASVVPRYVDPRRIAPLACVAFALLCTVDYFYFKSSTEIQRIRAREWSANFRTMVESLQMLPPPQKGEILYFRSVPEHLNPSSFLFAIELALHRNNELAVKLVEDFPPEARYRLGYQGSRIVMMR